ncbi:hypothetical protein Gohar_027366 [Gossypium harknessii]|uniref:Aminotransferase-like plant mobile domain-containing protein n=1 Tax=Gossypium harknessii TaxID=34285 RepID=A0A7J9HUH6_9ROSI|nr:hypothetical protein [Gossypium harknessii]
MTTSLIRFDDKHIFATQLAMGFIHNMGKPMILEIRGHLQAAGFLHASRMSRGCKLDLQLISVLVERWRCRTHTFHIPCNECTITLEDSATTRSNSEWASHHGICDHSGQSDPLHIIVGEGLGQVRRWPNIDELVEK